MLEYPIARAYADGRVSRIYGGAKEIIGRLMGLGERRRGGRVSRIVPP